MHVVRVANARFILLSIKYARSLWSERFLFISLPQYSTMLGSSGSAHSYFDSLMIDPNTGDQHKIDLGHLYCRQPYAVEIIQLVEVPAPARRFASSPIDSSSIASSSSSCYSSESESEYSSDDDEVESAGSSYCSSDSSEQINSEEEEVVSKPDETYDTRATRVHAWRASFAKDTGIASSGIYSFPAMQASP
jgi:hypothetical protein